MIQQVMSKQNFQKTTYIQEDSRFVTEIPFKVNWKGIRSPKLLTRTQLPYLEGKF
jgi:hypothetical protein